MTNFGGLVWYESVLGVKEVGVGENLEVYVVHVAVEPCLVGALVVKAKGVQEFFPAVYAVVVGLVWAMQVVLSSVLLLNRILCSLS